MVDSFFFYLKIFTETTFSILFQSDRDPLSSNQSPPIFELILTLLSLLPSISLSNLFQIKYN